MTDIETLLSDLNNHMLSLKNISNITISNNNESYKLKKQTKYITKSNSTNIFFPKQKDTLFWCFYIILYNYTDYEFISNYFTKEKEIKYKFIEEFRNNKSIFKPIKVSKTNVENELAHNESITMTTIIALCHLKNINIFYIDNKKYYDIVINENKTSFLIEKQCNKYGLAYNITKDKLEYYRNHFWKLEKLDKPIKSISSYTADELKDICKRLNIEIINSDTNVKLTKPKMYEQILYKLNS